MIIVRNLSSRCFLIGIASTLILFLPGCISNSFDADLKQVQIGDDKSRVLELLGNPRRTTRIKTVDHWIYTFPKNGIDQTEVVQFENGKVIKVADKTSNVNLTPENAETYEDYEKSVLKRRQK